MVEFITDCWQPRMTSLFAFKQIVTGSYLFTDDRLCFDVCGTADGHHGPVQENRGAEAEQETFAWCPFVV